MTSPSEMTSEQRREAIRELLIADLIAEGAVDENDVAVHWMALVGIHSLSTADENEEFGWVARVTSCPTPPSWARDGLIEAYRKHDWARYMSAVLRHDQDEDGGS